MPRVTFARSFDYRVPSKPSIVAYREGWAGTIPKAHAVAAGKAGALVEEAKDAERRPTE